MKRSPTSLALVVASAAIFSVGCQRAYLTDSIDIHFDFAPLDLLGFLSSDDLHLPYVLGSNFTIHAISQDEGDKETGWSLESSDEGVLQIISQADGDADCLARNWVSLLERKPRSGCPSRPCLRLRPSG